MRGKPNNLNNEEPEKKENHAVPDFADEAFWQDFSRELRRLLEPAEAPPLGFVATVPDAATKPSGTKRQTERRPLRRGKSCLSFSRCSEIGSAAVSSAAERAHLEICRFCVRRIEQFGINPLPAVPKTENVKIEAKIAPLPSPKKPFWARLFPLFDDNSKTRWSPTAFGLAGLAAILFGGLAFIVRRGNFNQPPPEILDWQPAVSAALPISDAFEVPASSNSNTAANFTLSNSGANASPPLATNQKESANENLPDNRNSDELTINFAALSIAERAAVRESLETGEITPSADLARLQNVPMRRSGENNAALPVSPVSEATFAAAPIFQWWSVTNAEYQITITDDAGREIAKAAILS